MAENSISEQAYRHEKIREYNGVSLYSYQAFSHTPILIYTVGMSKVNQHELAQKTEQIYAFIELYFFLPSYWNLEKDSHQWPLSALNRLIDAQYHKSAWFGPGDTFTAHPKTIVNDESIDSPHDVTVPPINSIFRQNHFFLTESIAAEPYLDRLKSNTNEVNWLGIMPIYQEEFDYKKRRSALELMLNFDKLKITELADEHRSIAVKKRIFGLFYK